MNSKLFCKGPILSALLSVTVLISPVPVYAQQLSTLEFSRVESTSTTLEYQLDGVLEAIQQSTISAQVAGRVEEINFDVGDVVRKGNVIARIRRNEYVARLEKAKAELNQAKAGLIEARLEFKRIDGLFKRKLV